MASERARNPLDVAALLDGGTLGVQVVHVLGPVLDRGIAQVRVLAHEQLDGAGVEVGHVVLGCRAALDEVQARVVLDDDERVLELARALGVEAEVALQGVVELRALGDVHERAARPHGAMQRGELVVRRRDELHEVVVDEALVLLVVQRLLDAGVHDAHLGRGILHGVVDELGVVLCADAGEVGLLGLGDAQTVEGVLDVVRDVVPAGLLLCRGLDVGDDVVHVEALDGGAPVGLGELVVDLERLQARARASTRARLSSWILTHDFGREARFQVFLVGLVVVEVVHAAIDVVDLCPFLL